MVKILSVSPDAGREPSASEIDLNVSPLKKQVSVFVILPDYRLLRAEAARRRIPLTSLFLEWITPHLADLRRRGEQPAD